MANDNKTDDSVIETVSREATPTRNAWLIRLGDEAHNRHFSVAIGRDYAFFQGVEEGDGVLIVNGDSLAVVSFARIYRIRAKLNETTFFFRWRSSRKWRKGANRPRCDCARIQDAHVENGMANFRGSTEKGLWYRLQCLARAGRRLRQGAGLCAGVASIGRH